MAWVVLWSGFEGGDWGYGNGNGKGLGVHCAFIMAVMMGAGHEV